MSSKWQAAIAVLFVIVERSVANAAAMQIDCL